MSASFLRPVVSYNVAIATTSTQGQAIGSGISAVRLNATAEAYVALGANPTVTTSNGMRVGPGVAGEIIRCKEGEKIAVIASAAGGVLNITELSA